MTRHMRDYMDRWVTPPKRVTSPTWGPPPPCKQAVRAINTQGGKLLVTIELNSIDNFNKRMIPYRSKMAVENKSQIYDWLEARILLFWRFNVEITLSDVFFFHLITHVNSRTLWPRNCRGNRKLSYLSNSLYLIHFC